MGEGMGRGWGRGGEGLGEEAEPLSDVERPCMG